MEMFAKIFHVDVFLLIIFVIVPVYCISFFIIFRKAILLKIFDDEEYEKNETFQIHLDEPSIVRRGSGNQFIAKTNQFNNYLKINSYDCILYFPELNFLIHWVNK